MLGGWRGRRTSLWDFVVVVMVVMVSPRRGGERVCFWCAQVGGWWCGGFLFCLSVYGVVGEHL